MMDHFRRGGVPESGVVIWKMSRFSRDIDDSQFYRADLRRRGYQVISISGNITEGPEGRFFEAAIDWLNERFLDDLSRDVKRGLSHFPTWSPNTAPYPAPRARFHPSAD
jgi:DNA invertase Pin-like site-specific DNA recombinase